MRAQESRARKVGLASEQIPDTVKATLTARFETLDPAELRSRIGRLQGKLYKLNARKNPRWKEEVEAPELEYIDSEAANQVLEYLSL